MKIKLQWSDETEKYIVLWMIPAFILGLIIGFSILFYIN